MAFRHKRPERRAGSGLIAAAGLALLCLLLIGAASARENVVFSRITTADGLSQESVNVITQDPAGFIWIGTQEGLNRFDGRQTRVYLHDPADPQSLPNDWINDILVTQGGDLWVGTQRGLARFSAASQQFTLIETPGSEINLSSASITVLHQDTHGHIWVGTEGDGLVVLDHEGQKMATLDQSQTGGDTLTGNGINDIASHPDGGVWVATISGGISLWHGDPQDPRRFLRRLDTGDRIIGDQVATLLPTDDGRLWLGTSDNGIAVLSPENGSIVRLKHDPQDYFTLSSDRVTALTQDAGGRIWVGTDKGLNLWDPERRGFHRYESDPGSLRSLSDNRITALHQDQGGVLWVGTYSGASTANTRIGSVEHFRNRPGEPGSLSSNVVTSFALSAAGDLFVGTFGGGLNHLPVGAQEFTVYRDGDGAGSLTDNRVMSLAMDRQDRLLLGTRGSGLFRFDPSSQKFTNFQTDAADPASISFNAVTSLLTDSQGTTWIATFGGGVNRLRDDDRFDRFNEAGGHLGSDRVITAVENPRNGEIWFGTHDAGIYVYNPRFNSWRPLDANRGLPSELIVSITFSMNDAWIGTRDRGLFRINLNELTTRGLNGQEYGRASGLPSNAVMGLITDSNNQVWVASNKGLSVISPDQGVRQTFNVTHGLQGDDFNSGAYLRAPDGTLYFGGNNGFNRFTPASLIATTNAFDPPVKLTGVSILNESQLFDQPVEQIRQLTLKHSDYVVGFEFAALDFTNPSANQYEYRLANLESSWNQVGNLNRANYTNLPPGQYRFEVRAANSDGVWSQNTLALAVVVLPPPWLTWWAFSLYATLAFVIVLVVGRAIASRARRQSERAANERLKTYLHCLNEATDSVAIVQPDGTLAYQNRASRMMFGDAESSFSPVFSDPERRRQALTQVEQRGRWQTTLQEGVGKDVQFIELTMTGVDLEQDDRAMIAIARDVTDQKRNEHELRRYRDQLKSLVEQRTAQLELEIVEHKATERQLRLSLGEKELLLKEVHHRVKNNMQVISSLLRLQTDSLEDPEVNRMLAESQNRIRSMALIHESLYHSENLLEIDFNDYLELLTSKLNRAYQSATQPIDIAIDAARMHLDIENAVPCGLIINELVSNAIKHAFVGHEGVAEVAISAKQVEDNCRITVADNGVGFPPGKDFRETESLGMEIVCILTEQLSGTISMHVDGGTCFTIEFPLDVPAGAETPQATEMLA